MTAASSGSVANGHDDGDRAWSEDLLDEVLPPGLEWERLTRAYPLPALVVAAGGGFLIGRSWGRGLVAAVAAWAGRELGQRFEEALGEGEGGDPAAGDDPRAG